MLEIHSGPEVVPDDATERRRTIAEFLKEEIRGRGRQARQ